MDQHKILIDELIKLLEGGGAHAGFDEALKGLPKDLRGAKPDNLPYSIWQLVEHIRIAQWDMLNFCIDPNHKSPKWPEEYWPKETEPKNEEAWDKSIKQIDDDLADFLELLHKEDIYKQIPHGTGQTILREALQIADHNSYHTAEIIAMRRVLGDWK